MHETFGLRADDARADNNYAFIKAAISGYIPVLKCLHEMYGLTEADAMAQNNSALIGAANNRHIDVLHWLQTTYGPHILRLNIRG